MATWHQQRNPVRLFHDTLWTVITDPPNEMTSLYRAATKGECETYLDGLHRSGVAHSYILPPASEARS